MANSPTSGAPILDTEGRRRRLSEENLLRNGDYNGSADRDLNGTASGFFDYMTSSTSTGPRKFGIIPRLRHILAKITLFLLPSFLSSYFTGATGSDKLAPTAWLDGLRGLACAVVVVHHYFGEYSKTIENPYDGFENTRLLQLPILKLIHYGPPMVKIFFVISGFVLTVKAVRITRVPGSIDTSALISNLSSSVWKRFLRLYIPCAAGFVLCAFMISAGMMEVAPTKSHPKWLSGPMERRPPTEDNIFKQLSFAFWDFYIFAVDITFFNIRDKSYATDGHLWTIPVEFKSSMQLFTILVGCCMLKRWLRVYVVLPILYTFLLYYGGWGIALFLFGYFLAELHSDILAAQSSSLPASTNEKAAPRISPLRNLLYIIMAFVGLYLISYPRKKQPSEHPNGYQFLIPLTPKRYPISNGKRADLSHEFWQSVGAMVLIWALMYLPRIQKSILCNKVVQYFGKISFALYIMHGQIHHSVGYWAVVNGLKLTGVWRYDAKSKNWDIAPGHEQLWNAVIGAAFIFITFPMTVCSADVFWRAADMQSVRFLRWLEPKLKR